MFKRLFTILTILVFISCGKDVVEIIDTPVTNEPQEIFEVNIIGYSTDSEYNFIEDVDLTINGNDLNTDSTSFFVENKILVGKEGSVIEAKKTGFLPTFKRVYHHRSLEDVVTNVIMKESPQAQTISTVGGILIANDGSELMIGEQTFSQSADVTFYSGFDGEQELDFDPFIVTDERVDILATEALFYVGSSAVGSSEGTVTISVNSDKVSKDGILVYHYDESSLTWSLSNNQISDVDGKLSFSIDAFGWWALGNSVPTTYGKLRLNQHDNSFTGIAPLRDTEVVFSKSGDIYSNEHLFSNNKGEIYKYYPIGEALEISLNKGKSVHDLDINFDNNKREEVIQLDEFISQRFSVGIFNCQLGKQTGFVAMISEDDFRIKRIDEGSSLFFTNVEYENMEFRFYNNEASILSAQKIETGPFNNPFIIDKINFVACGSRMQVENDDSSVVRNFEQCKVRVKPIESFIVGDDSNIQFFIAFKGDEVGVYDGLVFADDVPSFEVQNIEKDVKVDIMIYDKVTRTIAGFVDGEYKNGDKYKVSFIGNVEE